MLVVFYLRSIRMVWSGIVLILIVVCDACKIMDLLPVACLGVTSLSLLRSLTGMVCSASSVTVTHLRDCLLVSGLFFGESATIRDRDISLRDCCVQLKTVPWGHKVYAVPVLHLKHNIYFVLEKKMKKRC